MAHEKGEVTRAEIRRLDDGTLIYSVYVENKSKGGNNDTAPMMKSERYEYAFDDPGELSDAIAEDFVLKKTRSNKEEKGLESLK